MVGAGWFGIADYLGYWVPMIGYLEFIIQQVIFMLAIWLFMWLAEYAAGCLFLLPGLAGYVAD